MRTCDRHTGAGLAVFAFATLLSQPWTLIAQGPEPAKAKYAQINQAELKEWLSYLASDTLQGRQVFTEGYGLAAAYVADHLRAWGVKPAGDDGTFFENVKLRGYRVTRNSSVTVTAASGQSRTFKHGDHVMFPRDAADVCPNTFLDIGCDPFRPTFCGEHDVIEKVGICVRHNSPPRRLF